MLVVSSIVASKRRRSSEFLTSSSASSEGRLIRPQKSRRSSYSSVTKGDTPSDIHDRGRSLPPRIVCPSRVYRYIAGKTGDCCLSHSGTVALIAHSTNVEVLNLQNGTSAVFTEHTGVVRQVAISGDGKIGASASIDGNVCIWDTKTLARHRVLTRPGFDTAQGVALSADGNKLFATFSLGDFGNSCVVMHQWREENGTLLWHDRRNVSQCFASHDGSRILFVLGGGEVQIMDVSSAKVQCSFEYIIGMFNARMDSAGHHIVIADKLLCVHTVNPDNHAMITVDDYKQFRYVQCDITADGSRIIEMRRRSIIVRDARTGFHIFTLTHNKRLEFCRISADGSTIVACTTSKALVVWMPFLTRLVPYIPAPRLMIPKTQSKKGESLTFSLMQARARARAPQGKALLPRSSQSGPKLSSVEVLLRKTLDPKSETILTKNALFDALNTNNKMSLSVLFAGHNLLLIALRSGVLDPLELKSFLGIPYFFFSKLYLPFRSQLADECPEGQWLARNIFLHAEHLDIIEHAELKLNVAKTGTANREGFYRMKEGLQDFFSSISALLGTDKITRMGAIPTLSHRLRLSQNLTSLHKTTYRGNRKRFHLMLARCLLSLIQIDCLTLKHPAFSGKWEMLELSTEDVCPIDIDVNHCIIDKVGGVDVSNILVARYLFSSKGLSSTVGVARQVKDAIESSNFGSVGALNEALKQEACLVYREDKQMNLLNLVSSRWMMHRYVPAAKVAPLLSPIERDAGALFDEHVGQEEMMSYEHAITHVGSFVQNNRFRKDVSNVLILDALEETADDLLRVNKNAFVVACMNLVLQSLDLMFAGEDDEEVHSLLYHLLLQVSWVSKDPEGFFPSQFRILHDACCKAWRDRLLPLLHSFRIAGAVRVIRKWHFYTKDNRLLGIKQDSKSCIMFMCDFIMAYDQEENMLCFACPLSSPIIVPAEDLSMDILLDDLPEPQVHFIARRLVQLTGISWKFDCLAKVEQGIIAARRLKKCTDVLEDSSIDLEATSLDLLVGCEVGLLLDKFNKTRRGVGLIMFNRSFQLENSEAGIAYPTMLPHTTNIVLRPKITDYLNTSIGGVHNLCYIPKNGDFSRARGIGYSDPDIIFDSFLKLGYGKQMSDALREKAAAMLSVLPVDVGAVTLGDVLESLIQAWKNTSDRSMIPLTFRRKIRASRWRRAGDSFLVLNSGKLFIAKSKHNISKGLTIGLNTSVAQASLGLTWTQKDILTEGQVTSLFDAVSHLHGDQPSFPKMGCNWYQPNAAGMSDITGALTLLCVMLDGKVLPYGKFMGAVPAPATPHEYLHADLQKVCFDVPISYGLTYTTFASERKPPNRNRYVRDGDFCTVGVELWDENRNYMYPVIVAGPSVDDAVHRALFSNSVNAFGAESAYAPPPEFRLQPAHQVITPTLRE